MNLARVLNYGIATSVIAIAVTGAAPAAAQSEEIIVTAQRRPERLQDVPISISVLTAGDLAKRGVTDLSPSKLSVAFPAISGDEVTGRPNYFIRGVGQATGRIETEPSVAFYLDGVYLGYSVSNLSDFNNIERIEVLKGPQGTLFGRNATGGVIQVVTKDPSLTTPKLDAELGYANYGTYRGKVYVSTPLTDTLAIDLSAVYRNQTEGWGRNRLIGKDIYEGWSYSVRSKILFSPTDDTKVTLSADYAKLRNSFSQLRHPNGVPDSLGVIQPQTDGYDSFANFVPVNSNSGSGGSLKLEHNLGFARLENIVAYRKNRNAINVDADTGPTNFYNTGQISFQKLFTEEFHLINPSGSPVDWIVGLFYMDRKTRESPDEIGITYGNILGPLLYRKNDQHTSNKSFSPFAQATVEALPNLKITAGLRWTTETLDAITTQYTAISTIFTPYQKDNYKKWTWRLAADYKFTEDTHAYLSWNRGIKTGGFNNGAVLFPPYRSETLDAYEMGLKSKLFNGVMRLNIAAYYYDYRDIQIRGYPAPGQQITYNAGAASIKGIDVDADIRITPSLTLSAAFTALDTKVTSFDGQAFTYGISGGAQILFDPEGNRLPYASPFSGSLSLTHVLTTKNMGTFTTSADYSYNAGYEVDLYNGPGHTKFNSRSLVNASIDWTDEQGRWGVGVWGNNLTNEYYLVTLTKIFNGDLDVPAAPRTYGVTVKYHL